MAERAKGTLLQMSRMLESSKNLNPWVSPPSSDDEDDSSRRAPPTRTTQDPALQLHTLSSAVSILQRQLEQRQHEQDDQVRSSRGYVARQPVEQSRPAVPSGVDANLFRTIYDLGFEAGSSRREPEQPCSVCEERRRKNRIAAAEQRKRQREESA